MKKMYFIALFLLVGFICQSVAQAAGFPEKPLRIIVARQAGGSADMVARMFAPFLGKAIGQNVVVENVAGGSGRIGLSQAFRANPDGYTLILVNLPSYILTQDIEGGVDYVISEFEPIVGISGNEGNVLIVPGDSPFNSIKDIMDAEAKNPGTFNIGITSGLSNSSLAHAFLLQETKIDPVSIPYDDGNAVVTAVMGKHVDFAICSDVASYQPAKSGAIKVLCTFASKADHNLPNVPTFASLYGGEFAYDVNMGILGTPGIPADVLKIIRDAANKAVNDPEFKKTVGQSFSVVPATAEELEKSIESHYRLSEKSRELLTELLENN